MVIFVGFFTLPVVTLVAVSVQIASPSDEARYWTVERFAAPEGAVLEVGGLAVKEQRVALCTRRGEVWWLDGAFGDDATAATFTKAIEGLAGTPWDALEGWLVARRLPRGVSTHARHEWGRPAR